ncbi:MAG: hypothetical protein P1Q69_00275 [Candidatus Thorarchaeota archaeon]|nr:hypothetical protein [Candidatus Thorarchaeota archaeon]
MTKHKERYVEDELDNALWSRFAEDLTRREDMSEKDRQEEFGHLRHLSEEELFWKVCVRNSKKNREEWLEDMYDEIYSEWVIYLVEHQAAEDDYLKAMALVLMGISLSRSQAVSAWEKLSKAGFKGVIFQLPDDVFEIRLSWMPISEAATRRFTPNEEIVEKVED